MKNLKISINLLFILILIGCTGHEPVDMPYQANDINKEGKEGQEYIIEGDSIPNPKIDIPITDLERSMVAHNNKFAMEIMSAIVQKEPGENILFSPLSIGMGVNLLVNGMMSDEALTVIEKIYGKGVTINDCNGYYAKMAEWLPNLDRRSSVKTGNSLWYSPLYNKLNDVYSSDMVKCMNLEIFDHSFYTSADLGDAIGKWCYESTNGMIGNLDMKFNPFDPYLISTICFEASWQNPLDKTKTIMAPFYASDRIVDTEMMYEWRSGEIIYETAHFIATSKPYGNSAYSLQLILPKEGIEIEDAKDILVEEWTELMSSGNIVEGVILLPRFSADCNNSFSEVFNEMGLSELTGVSTLHSMWDSEPNSWIGPISSIGHIKVDEDGTIAASVTISQILADKKQPPRFDMIFDRPFIYAIMEESTGTLLFLGVMNDPSK